MNSKQILTLHFDDILREYIELGLIPALQKYGITAQSFYAHVTLSETNQLSYARSREQRADWLAEQITDIADTESCPHKARNKIDARKWVASKLRPITYGDRIDLNVNQTIDISGALQAARERVVKPLILNHLPCEQTRQSQTSLPIEGSKIANATSSELDELLS